MEGGHFLLPFSGSENEDQRNGSPDDLFIHPSTRLFLVFQALEQREILATRLQKAATVPYVLKMI